MKNKIKYYIQQVLTHLIITATSGAVLQTFLMEYGFSEQRVNIYTSVMQILQVAVIILFSKFVDRTRNVIKLSAVMRTFEIPFLIILLVLCFFTGLNKNTVFIVLFAFGALYAISMGTRSVIEYKIPYNIMDIRDYGKITSFCGVLIGIFSVGFSFLLSLLQSSTEYFFSMKIIFIITAVMIVSCISVTSVMRTTHEMPPPEKKEKTNIFKYKPYTRLIIPNLTRGFSSGIVGMAVTIGYFTGDINSSSASYIVITTSVVTIVGCLAFSFVSRRTKDGLLLLVCSIVNAATIPLLTVGGSTLFLIMFGITCFVKTIIDYGVPVTITKIIDYKIAGQYSAWRMLLHTLGNSIAGFVCIPLFLGIGVTPTLIIAGIMQLICGIWYFFYLKLYPPRLTA